MIMYFSNAFTGLLNVGMLIKTSCAQIDFAKYVLFPVSAALLTVLSVDTLMRVLPVNSILVYIILTTVISCPVYLFLISKIKGRGILLINK